MQKVLPTFRELQESLSQTLKVATALYDRTQSLGVDLLHALSDACVVEHGRVAAAAAAEPFSAADVASGTEAARHSSVARS